MAVVNFLTIFGVFVLASCTPAQFSIFSNTEKFPHQNQIIAWDSSLKQMNPNEVSETIARSMGFPSPMMVKTSSVNPLPAANPFNSPQFNLLISVSGGQLIEWNKNSFIASQPQNGFQVNLYNNDNRLSSMFGLIMGAHHEIPLPNELSRRGMDVLCATSHENARDSHVCETSRSLVYSDQGFIDQLTQTKIFDSVLFLSSLEQSLRNSVILSYFLDQSSDNVVQLNDGKLTMNFPKVGSLVLDLSSDMDIKFLLELEFLARLPKLYTVNDDSSKMVIASFSQFQPMINEFGVKSEETRVIAALTDIAAKLLYNGFSELFPSKMVGELLMTPEDDWSFPQYSRITNFSPVSRRLFSSSNSSNYTLEQIANYNMSAWTGVFLILVLLASVYFLATMEITRDSLIYAKFQTDVSNAKND